MIISILGPAGSGKSTQAGLIAKQANFEHISVGQLLRESHGGQLNEYMKTGNLINPMVVNGLLQEKLDQLLIKKPEQNILLDGYPREMEQAEWLISNKDKYPVRLAIIINCDTKEVTNRLLARKRIDDNIDAIKKRLEIYQTDTKPVIEYLKSQGIFIMEVDGNGKIEDINQKIMEQLKYVLSA